MKEYEIIHASVWNPNDSIFKASKSDKSECTVIKCSNKDNCQLFNRGECMMLGAFPSKCPYGTRSVETGWTKNARKFHTWIRDKKEQFKDYLGKLKSTNKKMAVVGEYIYLPYTHINFDTDVPFISKSSFMSTGTPMLKIEDFTVSRIKKMICNRPQAMMGGEITSYQKDEVPKFILHMQEQYPNLLAEVLAAYPELNTRLKAITNVGRKAYLWTLEKNITIHDKEYVWHWDGEYLTSTNAYLPFTVVSYQNKEVKIKPVDKAIIKVEFDNWCNADTVFID